MLKLSLLKIEMEEYDYIPVEEARRRLGISPGEMAMLLDAGALRFRKGRLDETIKEVYAQDVRDAVEHLAYRRQEEKGRIRRPRVTPESSDETETCERSFFNLSDSDLSRCR